MRVSVKSAKITLENSPHYLWGESCEGWKLMDRADVSIIYESMPPETAEQRHYHFKSKQFFFILKGTASMKLDHETHFLTEKEGIWVKEGQNHQIVNNGTNKLDFLLISWPAAGLDRVNT